MLHILVYRAVTPRCLLESYGTPLKVAPPVGEQCTVGFTAVLSLALQAFRIVLSVYYPRNLQALPLTLLAIVPRSTT